LRSIVVGLLVLAGLVGPVASAQTGQRVVTEMRAGSVESPDELPGVLEVPLEAETWAAGGQCACTETHVNIEAVRALADVDVSLSPKSFVVHWPTNDWEPHEIDLAAAIDVPDTYQNESMVQVTLAGTATSTFEGEIQHSRVLELDLALEIPDSDVENRDEDARESNASAAHGDGSTESDASTQSVPSPDEGPGLDNAAGGTGAGVAGLTLVALAARRGGL
jgi:hypothetical protein